MSPSNINSFVGDLVQMAKAMETLPQVEAENERLNGMVESYAKQVQALELRAIDRNAEISALHDRIRSLEVERDDASFRVLEMEDKTNTVEQLADSAKAMLEKITSLIVPPKPEPMKEPEAQAQPVATPAEGSQSALDPIASQTGSSPDTLGAHDWQQDKAETSLLPPGQSESSPTVETGEVQSSASGTLATGSDVGSTSTETTAAEPTHGPYFGKRYQDVQGFVSYTDWINGGGTEKDYDLPF